MRKLLFIVAMLATTMSFGQSNTTASAGKEGNVLKIADESVFTGREYGEWSDWYYELECSDNAILQSTYAIKKAALMAGGATSNMLVINELQRISHCVENNRTLIIG